MQLHGSLQDLRQGDDSVTQFLQKAKTLFDELVAAGRPISLTDFNLYVFRGLHGEFKDLVTSLVTRADPLPYADLLSHLRTHEFIHKSSHLSMGSAAIHAPLLTTLNIPPSALFSHRQSSAQFGHNRSRSYGSWHPQQNLHRGSRNSGSRPDFRSFHSTPSNDNRHGSWQGNWQRNRGSNSHCQLCQNFGHTAPQCSQLQQRGYGQQHSANLALHNSAGTAD